MGNHRQQFEDGMSEELRFHIEQFTEDLVRSGVSRDEAARRARVEFGSVTSVQQECREASGFQLVDELSRQLRYAFRLLRKTPGFTAAASLTLAICLGANLAIFAVVDSVLLRPLPFPNAGRLVTIYNTYPKAGVERDGASFTNYYERRGRIPALDQLSLYRFDSAIAGNPGSTESVEIARVSPEFFSTLGARLQLGRAFQEEETTGQTDGVAILTDAWWRERLNRDPHILGRQIRVDGRLRVVVGVLPPDFRFLSSKARLYFPLTSRPQDRTPRERHSGGNVVQMIGRLKPGASIAQAQSQIDAQNSMLEADNPKGKAMADAGFRSMVVSLHGDHVASIRPTLLLMQAAAFGLLLIGVVNLVNLLLVRANGRVKESAVRQALGAGRAHLVSEVVVETAVLALGGGLLGLLIGAAGIRLLATLGADRIPLGSSIAFDLRIALAGLAGTLITGIVLAAPIAWFHLRDHLGVALQSESRGGTSGRRAQRLRHAFVVAQIAMALILLVGAGLLGLSLERAMTVSPGFRADHALSGQISVSWKTYPTWTARLAFNDRLLRDLTRQPGVSAAGLVNNVPFSGRNGKASATVKGHVPRPGEPPRGTYAFGVDGDYFTAMGMTLQGGRFLTADDSRRPARACVVDDDFARFYWPHASALGQQLFLGAEAGPDVEAFTVVGVVGAAKQAGLTDDEAIGAVYYPYAQRSDGRLYAVVRTSLPPDGLTQMLQKVVRAIDPDLPVSDVASMDTRIADSLIARRSPALLAALFSAIAVLLTAVGTYGVLSYSVAQRRREIGLRMALGARPEQICQQFVSLALWLFAIGTLLGVAGAWLTGQAMQTMLFRVPGMDWTTVAVASGIMGLVSLAACLLPAIRAARISPTEALADQ